MSFLQDMPSKGYFKTTPENAVFKLEAGVPKYIAYHDESAAEPQMVSTDKTNILIRSLLLRRQRQMACDNSPAANPDSGSSSSHGGYSRPSNGKKRMQEAEFPQNDSRKRAHIRASAEDEGAAHGSAEGSSRGGCAVGGGFRVSESERATSIAREQPSEGLGNEDGEGMDVDEGGSIDSCSSAGGQGQEPAQRAESSRTVSPAASVRRGGGLDGSADHDEEYEMFRAAEERERGDAGPDAVARSQASAVTSAGATAGLQAQKISALREKCKQMGIPSQGKKEVLVTRILGCSP
mmetsp:Transcript_25208/g.51279  ORF Transcript_25208/g.51279 Transcript_25208/m.51279 type:complete len:293 (-) Transcript_25208:98-976(-)